jgi:isopenicillin-N N-acyltransferase like protein
MSFALSRFGLFVRHDDASSIRRLALGILIGSWLLLSLGPALAEDPIPPSGPNQTIARCGQGWLELVNGYRVLHLKGTPAEMGAQHGALLRDAVRSNMHNLLTVKGGQKLVEIGPLKLTPKAAIQTIVAVQKPYVPARYFEELEALAAAAGLSANDVRIANFIPELFHCSGFALMKSATQSGTLYHGRVLDYAVDWGLQDHAVLIVAEPEGRKPWVNVTYAGFIGSVTGMNQEHVSIGEMGGGGLGHWGGMPMAFLVREALETATSLEDAITTFRDTPRTCQYFYVIADGRQNSAVGMEASWNVFETIQVGESHPLLPKAVPDCVLLSAGGRYEELVRRAEARHGKVTVKEALELMERPVAMKSNLHNVLFEPATTRFWVANASSDKRPAAEQPYYEFSLNDLLSRQPDSSSPELPLVTVTTTQR